MTERLQRILAEAIAAQRPVLVNPTEDEIRLKAVELQQLGRLTCTYCRKPIAEAESFCTRRIAFGPRLQAVANLHDECQAPFEAGLAERAQQEA